MKTCIYIYNVNVLCMYIWSGRCPFLEPLPRAAQNAGAVHPQGLPGRRGPFKGAGRGGRGSAAWPLIGWRNECRPHDSEVVEERGVAEPLIGCRRAEPAVPLRERSGHYRERLGCGARRFWSLSGSGAAGTGPAGLCQEGSRPRGRAPRPSG